MSELSKITFDEIEDDDLLLLWDKSSVTPIEWAVLKASSSTKTVTVGDLVRYIKEGHGNGENVQKR